IQMLQALYDAEDGPRYIVCRQETGAAYMADGYYRASGKLGAVMVTTGPGATNALTGVMNAEAGGSAMLLLTGEIAEQFSGMGYLQEGVDGKLDVNDVYKASVAYSTVLTSEASAQRLTEAALRTALDVPRHAAHLSLPVNISMAKLPADMAMPKHPSVYRSDPPVAETAKVTRALELMASAKRPLIMLGNGCREALRDPGTLQALTHLVESRGIPVMTTADGKGVFPEDHDLSLRAYGIANAIWPFYWMSQTDPAYDALMVIGSGLGELATDKWKPLIRPKGPIIQVDANARIIARDFRVELGIVGEAGDFIRQLAKQSGVALPLRTNVDARKAKVAQIKKEHSAFAAPGNYYSQDDPLQPAALCRVMQEELPEDNTIVMLDAGNCVGWGVHYLTAKPGFEVHSSLDMGPMGFAVGAVVGAKLARPDAACVAITGDGAFMMQGAEISTAQRHGIGAIWIVLHDNDLAMVSQGMEHFKHGEMDRWRDMFSLGQPDLAKFAEGLGAVTWTVSNPKELRDALQKARNATVPQVIVAEIDRTAEPPYYNELYVPSKDQARAIAAREGDNG
ncbi:MAG: thiamine pyrophosphate-binding protein, partial [bacterium]